MEIQNCEQDLLALGAAAPPRVVWADRRGGGGGQDHDDDDHDHDDRDDREEILGQELHQSCALLMRCR